MSLKVHNALGGINDIIKFANNTKEKGALSALLVSLKTKDVHHVLECEDTKKMKGMKVNVCEIIKGSLRIFYVLDRDEITIIHICRKQKNKTEQKDLNTIKQRLKK